MPPRQLRLPLFHAADKREEINRHGNQRLYGTLSLFRCLILMLLLAVAFLPLSCYCRYVDYFRFTLFSAVTMLFLRLCLMLPPSPARAMALLSHYARKSDAICRRYTLCYARCYLLTCRFMLRRYAALRRQAIRYDA